MRLLTKPGVIVAAVLALILAACSQREAKENTRMSTELEMKHEIDLGIILDTTIPIELFIPVKNRGERKVTISKVSKDCSCTSVSIDKTVLQPGETAHVRVSTNLTGKTNVYIGEVIIESDATEKIDEIQVRGQITGQIRVRPLRTAVIMGDKYTPGNFTVFSDDQNGKWNYVGFTADDPNLKAELNLKSESPTTATYAGVVSLPDEATRKGYPDFRTSMLTLKFTNDHLRRNLELRLAVDLVIRRKLTTDPPQVTFDHATKDQKRTVLVQSGDPIDVDSVACSAPCVKSNLRRIDTKTLMVELAFEPTAEEVPEELACELKADGKMIASIPIHVVRLP